MKLTSFITVSLYSIHLNMMVTTYIIYKKKRKKVPVMTTHERDLTHYVLLSLKTTPFSHISSFFFAFGFWLNSFMEHGLQNECFYISLKISEAESRKKTTSSKCDTKCGYNKSLYNLELKIIS